MKDINRWWIVGGLALVIGLVWYFWPKPAPDLTVATDAHIQSWLDAFETKNAFEFFESDGMFMDAKFHGQNLDETVILPLITRIRETTGAEAQAVFQKERPGIAGGMYVELPDDPAKLKQLRAIFVETDEAFDGVVLRQYGAKWMQFELLDPKTAKMSGLENWIDEEI